MKDYQEPTVEFISFGAVDLICSSDCGCGNETTVEEFGNECQTDEE